MVGIGMLSTALQPFQEAKMVSTLKYKYIYLNIYIVDKFSC